MIYIFLFLSLAIISAVSLIGVLTLNWSAIKLNNINAWLISIAAGSLLGDSFLHLLPEATENQDGLTIWLYLIAGLVAFFILEKIIHWRHCHILLPIRSGSLPLKVRFTDCRRYSPPLFSG